jgi:predicted nucleotidyltransferase
VHTSLHDHADRLLAAVTAETQRCYGDRLVSLVVFGSMGRGTARPDSDLDLLVVADDLPRGRRARLVQFETVERGLAPVLADGRSTIATAYSPPPARDGASGSRAWGPAGSGAVMPGSGI